MGYVMYGFVLKTELVDQWSGRFSGITGWYPSVCKSNWLYVDILRFSFIDLGYIPYIPLKWPVIFLQSWTSTGYFSNLTGSPATNCWFSPIIVVDWRNFGLISSSAYLWLTLMHCRSRRISFIQSSQSPAMETNKAFEVPSGRTPLEMTYLEVSSSTQNSTSVYCIVLTEGAFTRISSSCGYGLGPLSTTTAIYIYTHR